MSKPAKALRWTIQAAADEFGCDRKTLAKQLKMADESPGEDGRYSTRQIYVALAGDLDKARIREANARAEKLEMEVAELRKLLVRTPLALAVMNNIVIGFRQAIKHSSLSPLERESILAGLREQDAGDIVGRAVSAHESDAAGTGPSASATATNGSTVG